jgi:nucleoside-diphosphate-sugar epimerase
MNVLTNKMRLSNMAHNNPLVTGDEKIAVFGAGGQIGTKLKPLLEELYQGKVLYCDAPGFAEKKGMLPVDITNPEKVTAFIKENNVKAVINLAALLSAAADEHPELARKVNLFAPLQLMEICHKEGVKRVMMMSSMAAQEFSPHPDDTDEIKKMRAALQEEASTSLVSIPKGSYGRAKLAMELQASLYHDLGLGVVIPRLAGVLNAHTPWPSNGTTEELDKLVVAAAIHKVYGEKWQDELQKRLQKYHPEAATKGHYIKDGAYVPEVSADATFDMVDGKTLPEAVLMTMHRDLHKNKFEPIVNVSEYTISMGQAAEILKSLDSQLPVKFAASEEQGLDAGKMKRAKDWSASQNTTTTKKIIGEFQERPALSSIRDAYNNAVSALRAERMAEMDGAVAPRPDGKQALG